MGLGGGGRAVIRSLSDRQRSYQQADEPATRMVTLKL
jgi:hypothetical protein